MLNSVVSVSIRFGKTTWANLLIISGSPDLSHGSFTLFHTTLVNKMQFLIRRFLEPRWPPQLIMEGSKILRTGVEKHNFLDSHNYLPVSVKKMSK